VGLMDYPSWLRISDAAATAMCSALMSAAVSCSAGVAEPGRLDTLRRPRGGRFQ
jgi:hypothetical protein